MVEVHPNPDKAWSDGEQSLDFAEFDAMMAALDPGLRCANCTHGSERQHSAASPMEAVG